MPAPDAGWLAQQPQDVLAVVRLAQRLGQPAQVVFADEAHAPGHLFETGDLEALPRLDDLDEVDGLVQRLVGPGVEPGRAAAQHLDDEAAAAQIVGVEVGDLELAARRRLQARRRSATTSAS